MALKKLIEVSDPQHDILTSVKDQNLFLAGAGSGKTHCSGLLAADFVINFPKAIGLIGANTYNQLSKSTLKNIQEVWRSNFGWINGVQYVIDKIPPAHFIKHISPLKSYDNTICMDNGCIIFTASLDNYKVIDGIEIAWALLDETKDTKEEAVKDVIMWRLRQKAIYKDLEGTLYDYPRSGTQGFNPLYIFTTPAKVDWINEWFGLGDQYEEISRKIFSKTDYYKKETEGKCVVISSTYHNEHNLPAGYIDKMIAAFAGNQNKVDMMIYGSPIAKSGGEFFSRFSRLDHVGKIDFIPGVNIHISFDFNVTPYNTMTCWQIVQDKELFYLRCFDEICLSSPQNNTEDLCKEFILRYVKDGKLEPLFYYGDASGNNRSTVSKEDNFDVVERVLKKYLNDNSNRVTKSNPSVVKTRDFLNKIFVNGTSLRIIINEKCKNLITDCEFLKEHPDGGKLIVHATDPISGTSYEKYGHTSDSMRYFVCRAFDNLFNNE